MRKEQANTPGEREADVFLGGVFGSPSALAVRRPSPGQAEKNRRNQS
jgi:hypothetical protein